MMKGVSFVLGDSKSIVAFENGEKLHLSIDLPYTTIHNALLRLFTPSKAAPNVPP